MKRTLSIVSAVLFGAVLMSACGQQHEGGEGAAALTLAKFMEQPEQFIDKKIVLEGTVTHVCKHGGKRLHLTDTETNDRMKVELGENMPAFARELEGANIIVTGMLRETRIDKQYLDEWEQEVLAEQSGEHEDAGHVDPQGLQAVNAKREELAASGKPYLSMWHVECISYKMKDGSDAPQTKDATAEEEHGHDHDHDHDSDHSH
jgi:hypothetical protein